MLDKLGDRISQGAEVLRVRDRIQLTAAAASGLGGPITDVHHPRLELRSGAAIDCGPVSLQYECQPRGFPGSGLYALHFPGVHGLVDAARRPDHESASACLRAARSPTLPGGMGAR